LYCSKDVGNNWELGTSAKVLLPVKGLVAHDKSNSTDKRVVKLFLNFISIYFKDLIIKLQNSYQIDLHNSLLKIT
jgi:hypothetical protein